MKLLPSGIDWAKDIASAIPLECSSRSGEVKIPIYPDSGIIINLDDETHKVADRRDIERPHLAFGRELENLRKSQRLGRPELAELAGVSYPMLANVETGRRRASDELLAKLAPHVSVPPQQMIEIRDVRERAPAGIMPGAVVDLAGKDLLAEAMHATVLLDAASGRRGEGDESRRGTVVADLIRDLFRLEDTDLAAVRGYVDGLLAARDRVATAVNPIAKAPLVQVPGETFGPLRRWTVAPWLRRLVVDDRDAAEWSTYVRHQLQGPPFRFPFSTGEPSDEGFRIDDVLRARLRDLADAREHEWPSPAEMAYASEVGRFLRGEPYDRARGYAEAKSWLEFAVYRGPQTGDRANDLLLAWLTRISFVAWATKRDAAGTRAFFADCIDEFGSDLFLPEVSDEPSR